MKKGFLLLSLILLEIFFIYEFVYQERIYPGVFVEGKNFGNWKREELESFFSLKNQRFSKVKFIFSFEEKIATVSAKELNWGYNPKKIAQKAFLVGRSGHFFLDLQTKFKAFFKGIFLEPLYDFNEKKLREFLKDFEKEIYEAPQDALFQFKDGRVIAFRKEKEGRQLDIEAAISTIRKNLGRSPDFVRIELTTRPIKPEITIENANNLGLKGLLGRGISYYWGSSPSRIHNITLATSRLSGFLIKPGEIFSFNRALGDISQATGYQQAYIIKEGKTILGDGGGVCQVSTTLFRAALEAGLPIIERWPHSYRVSYYEQGGFGPGFDATVFYPSVDLKFKNDTPAYILIQAKADNQSKTLFFEIYGTDDGRKVTITKPKIWEQIPPPDDLYRDDPTLPQGVVKQIERKAWGAKVSFERKIEKNGQVLEERSFYSSYQPWQAVYLRGTGGPQ